MVGAQGLFRYASFTALIGFADRRTSVRLSLVVEPFLQGSYPYAQKKDLILNCTRKPVSL